MKRNKHLIGLVIINLVCLIGSLSLACVALRHQVPHEKRTQEEFRAHIEKVTSEERLQRLFIADDEDIRALEHLADVERNAVIFLSCIVCGFSLINLAIIPWKKWDMACQPKL